MIRNLNESAQSPDVSPYQRDWPLIDLRNKRFTLPHLSAKFIHASSAIYMENDGFRPGCYTI